MLGTKINRIPSMPGQSLVCLLVVAFASPAIADDHRDNAAMYQLIRPIAESVQGSVVQILSGGTPVALGTVVSGDGYVLTKRSELSGDPIRIRLGDKRLLPARVAAVRRRNDLALLRIESAVTLPPIQFSNVVPPVASFLISPGRTGRPIGFGVIGVKSRQIQHQGRLGVMLTDDSSGRALVDDVFPDSGAEHAGIAIGDLIIAIDGREKNSRTGVIETLRDKFPGERVRLTILRTNESREIDTLEMDARIREFGIMAESESDSKVNGPRNIRLSGFDQVIQHDTVLDPDECGGPVLDTSGRVVGLNIARAGRVVSYSLPSSLVIPEITSMLEEARAAAR
jgi:S1-C subfamily serine protease